MSNSNTIVYGLGVMSIDHPRWTEFIDRLAGKEGCNVRSSKKHGFTWDCDNSAAFPLASKILTAMGASSGDIENSIAYFKEHSAYCDCEILWNVAPV